MLEAKQKEILDKNQILEVQKEELEVKKYSFKVKSDKGTKKIKTWHQVQH